jgi:hypothetical protein
MDTVTTVPTQENTQASDYIVTRSYSMDYPSTEVYLTKAISPNEAIINCMEHRGDMDDDNEKEYAEKLSHLRSLSLEELENYGSDDTIYWSAEEFEMPTLGGKNAVVMITSFSAG